MPNKEMMMSLSLMDMYFCEYLRGCCYSNSNWNIKKIYNTKNIFVSKYE